MPEIGKTMNRPGVLYDVGLVPWPAVCDRLTTPNLSGTNVAAMTGRLKLHGRLLISLR